MTQPTQQKSSPERSGPWWRYPHMWLVVGGPAVAVVASFISLYCAVSISKTDTLYSDPLHPQDGSAPHIVAQPHLLPAEEARNHATTGGVGAPDLKKAAPKNGQGSGNEPVDD